MKLKLNVVGIKIMGKRKGKISLQPTVIGGSSFYGSSDLYVHINTIVFKEKQADVQLLRRQISTFLSSFIAYLRLKNGIFEKPVELRLLFYK